MPRLLGPDPDGAELAEARISGRAQAPELALR